MAGKLKLVCRSMEEILAQLGKETGPSCICTFNAYLDKDGLALVKKLLGKKGLLVIGVPPYTTHCCDSCREKYARLMERFALYGSMLPNVRFCIGSHLKAFSRGKAVYVGGINLSSSGFTDMSALLTSERQKGQVRDAIEELWYSGYPKPPKVPPMCSCGKRMVMRNGSSGWFYGCTNYPECRGTRNAI